MDLFQWMMGGLAILGVALAAPSFFQQLCGRPCIRLEAAEEQSGADLRLVVKVQNRSVLNPFLSLLRVRRVAADGLRALVEIREDGTARLLAAASALNGHNFRLVPGGDSVRVEVARVRSEGQAVVGDAVHGRAEQPLPPGRYHASVMVDWVGGRATLSQPFDVGCAAPVLAWS